MQIHNPILTGSFIVNGVDVSSITGSSTYSASFAAQITSLNTATASLNTYTSSNNTNISALNAQSASFLAYTASNDAKITSLNTFSSSILSYTSSNDAKIASIYSTTSSLNSYTSSANTKFAGLDAASGSAITRLSALEVASGSAITRLGALETASGSAITRLGALETASGSAITRLNSIENKTGSYATTGSNIFIGTQTITGSIFGSGSLTINGCITSTGQIVAQTINVQQVTSSIVYSCGSNIFGTAISNSQQLTGSVLITGSLTITGPSSATSYNGATIFGSTIACSPIGCFATSCATVALFTGCVGIGGTLNPSNPLHIYTNSNTTSSAIKLQNASACCLASVGIEFQLLTDFCDYKKAEIRAVASEQYANSIDLAFWSGGSTTDKHAERLRITSAGNVGIGTPSPSYPLDVAGTSRSDLHIFRSNQSAPTADAFIFRPADNTIALGTANIERLRITSTGIACFACQVCAPAFVGGTVCGTNATFIGQVLVNTDTSTNGQLVVSSVGFDDTILRVEQRRNGYASALNLIGVNDAGAAYNYIASGTNSGVVHWRVGGNGTACTLVLSTAGSERLTISSTGVACFSSTVCTPFLSAGNGTQSNEDDAPLTIKRGVGFAGLDFKSLRTTGNIGGIRFYDCAGIVQAQQLIEVDGSFNFYNATSNNRFKIAANGIACFACKICVPNIISTGASGGRYGTFNAPTNGGYITFEAGGTAFGDLGSYCAQYGTGDATTLSLQSRTGYALALGTNSTEKVRIDTTGNLMVGSLSAGNAGTINVSVGCAGTTAGGLQLWATTAQTHYVQFGDGTAGAGPYAGYVGYAHATDTLLLGAGAATRAIITSAGVACFSSTVCAPVVFASTSIFSSTYYVNSYNSLSSTLSGQMGVLGHNAISCQQVSNTITQMNNGYYGSFIRQYYNEGITFYTRANAGTAGDVLYGTSPVADGGERLRITSTGIACFACQVCAPSFNSSASSTLNGLVVSCNVNSNCFTGITVVNSAGGGSEISRAGIAFQAYDWVQSAIWHGRNASAAFEGALVFGTNPNTANLSVGGVCTRLKIDNDGIATFYCNICTGKYLSVGSQGGSDIVFLGGGSGVGATIEARYADGNPNVRLTGNGNSWLNRTYGSVGIGTCTPAYKLDVSGATRVGSLLVTNTTTTTWCVGRIDDARANTWYTIYTWPSIYDGAFTLAQLGYEDNNGDGANAHAFWMTVGAAYSTGFSTSQIGGATNLCLQRSGQSLQALITGVTDRTSGAFIGYTLQTMIVAS